MIEDIKIMTLSEEISYFSFCRLYGLWIWYFNKPRYQPIRDLFPLNIYASVINTIKNA